MLQIVLHLLFKDNTALKGFSPTGIVIEPHSNNYALMSCADIARMKSNLGNGSAAGREQRRRPYAAHGPRPPWGFPWRLQFLFDGLKEDILVGGDVGCEPSHHFTA